MYSSIIRDDQYKSRLLDYVQSEYGIDVVYITPAKRGFYGETWRLSAVAASYFLKLVYAPEHKVIYEGSLPVVQHLCDHGIDFISRVVKTKTNRFSTQFDGATLGVFDWIEGENKETDATKIPEYQMLAKVYAVSSAGLTIPKEDFSSRYSGAFWLRRRSLGERQTISLLEKKREKLEYRSERLHLFSRLCRDDQTGFVITHGDAGGNFFMSNDRNYIVDWDGVTLAPPERDAWVMCSHDWARDAFHNALRQGGIAYNLRSERLAYYCYRFFFFYLNSFIDTGSEVEVIEKYIDSWIEDSIRWADGITV